MADKVKLSDIRAQFPMYADLPDEQLLIGLRKKFYADIPMADFVKRIDFDTQRQALQTEAAQASGPFLSGVGQAFSNLGLGVKQALGMASREDVADSRKLDAGLSSTLGGKVGNITGNVAAMLPAALIPGANAYAGAAGIGAVTGALQPSASTQETLTNTGIGAAAGPAGLLLGRGLVAGGRALGGLVAPFTKNGQEAIAARTLQQFATDPKTAAAALRSGGEIVPGSLPTMAQASGDAGLAQLERTLANNPETGKQIAAQYAAQRGARLEALGGIAGDAAKRKAAVAARDAAADPLYKAATGQAYQMDSALTSLLDRPAMKAALERAGRLAANDGRGAPVIKGAAGQAPSITGRGLQDVKMALDDMLSDPMAGIGKSEANAVKSARAQLIDWMEKANPAFKAARETFAEKSTPINTMDVARELMSRLEPALARYGATSKEHASAYAQALDAAKESVKKATGINRPMDEVIDSQAKKILENIAKDLARKVKAEDLGRAVGSNTAQNLAAQNLLRRTLGPTGLPQSWAESNVAQGLLAPYTAVARMGGSEKAMTDRLAQAVLDPKDAARLLEMAAKENKPIGLLRYMPSVSLGYSHQ